MATYTNFDDEIFAQAALEGFTSTLTPLSAFSVDWEPSPVPKGNTVLVPLIGALTATTFSTYETTNGSLSAITVTINKHKIIGVGQSDLDAAGSSLARLERFGFQQGAALALLVFQDICSLWTTANFGLATAVSVVDFGGAQIRAKIAGMDAEFLGMSTDCTASRLSLVPTATSLRLAMRKLTPW